MQIRVGDTLASTFGQGKVVAITREWVIHEDKRGSEVALHRDDEYWIPVTGHEEGGGLTSAELQPSPRASNEFADADRHTLPAGRPSTMQNQINAQVFYRLITDTSERFPEIASIDMRQDDGAAFEDWYTVTVHQATEVKDEFYVVVRSGAHDESVTVHYSERDALDAARKYLEIASDYDTLEVTGELAEEEV